MKLIYFSPVKWNSFAQRPHKFVEWYYRHYECEVVWVDPYPTRLPKLNDLLRKRSGKKSFREQHLPPWLTVVRPKSLPVEPLFGIRAINLLLWRKLLTRLIAYTEKEPCVIVVAKPSILALTFLKRHSSALAVYDAMDDFGYFYRGLSKLSMFKRDLDLVAHVHSILASSSVMYAKYRRLGEDVEYVPNAFDSSMINCGGVDNSSAEKAVIGYIGTIGQWFDWQLVVNLARSNPNVYVKIIGPVFKPPPMGLPKNVAVLPSVNHHEAIEIMRGFTVGLIPFIANELTASVDPIKYYEYRALGLPILTTAFGEMAERIADEGVFRLDGMANMRAAVEAAIKFKISAASLALFRKENNWEARFSAIEVFRAQAAPSHGS